MARVLFMGSPDFAVPTLENLVAAGHQLVGVFCQPDKPVGRKQELAPPAVKLAAERMGLPVFQPAKLRDPEAIALIRSLIPDVIVVAAYGKILPKAVLEIPPKGCLNVHASLLPKYRGAAPIQWAIAQGESETGATIMLMDEGLDTGPSLAKAVVPIDAQETGASLFHKLAPLGAQLLIDTLPKWLAGAIDPVAQNEAEATLAPILSRADALVDWELPAEAIARRSRAFTPWPGTYTLFREKPLKLLEVAAMPGTGSPGTITRVAHDYFDVATRSGVLRVFRVQLAGSQAMPAGDFVRGQRLEPGETLQQTLLA